jgi:aspergillopepsin I
LAKPVFAATLKHNAPGSYDFGFIDSSKYTGQLAYTPVNNSQGFWQFTADGYRIGGQLSGGNSSSINAVADTGTTLLLLDDSVVSAYYSNVTSAQNSPSVGGYVFPCNASLPDFSVTIAAYTAVVPGRYINFLPTDQTKQTCFGGIQSNSGLGFSIFGDVFLKSQYVVFDASGPRLGFAAKA